MTAFLQAFPRRVVVFNPAGRYGQAQVAAMRAAGTQIVAGIAPGRGGTVLDGVPLFDDARDMPEPADAAVLYTPPEGLLEAVGICADLHIPTIVAAAEYAPLHDGLAAAQVARAAGSWLVGPNTLGLCVPGVGVLGSIAPDFCAPGRVALLSRSGTLTLAMARALTTAGIGQRIVVNIGGDAVIGRNPDEWVAAVAADPGVDAVVYCGELGGTKEYALCEAMPQKPLVAMIVGRHAPAGTRMGHAGALAGAERETAAAKIAALAAAGALVADGPAEVIAALRGVLR
ncbi:CoA-binding protein [Humitalea sp. 24SJ18S-53]|uniref:CoA-binding protein n=1 Tax=Humitalea sp. 24SJ18S-53 TaxID=3422307 RepID=UPI003D66A10A